ncbi:MAG: choice-of-anchor Q domain-containing protein, partial [Anaerolineae bacterium]
MTIKSNPILLILSFIGLLLFATIIFVSRPTQAAGVIHVNAAVSGGSNDGTSWTNAYSDLQSALGSATNGDEIWVAKGVYTPGNAATDTFQLVENVAIYGGFDGVETIRSERDWKTNLTVLSGDIDDNDTADSNGVLTTTANIVGTNSYHVVTGSGVSGTAVLDGFTVTAGQATGVDPHNRGGGLLNVSGSPTLINVTFAANSGNGGGGLFNNNQSNPALTNVSFVANSAVFDGGAVFNNNQSGPTFINVSFSANSAPIGGAVFNNNQSDPTFTNATFSANSATGINGRGGGMLNANSNPTLINSILWGNSATTGANIHNDASTPVIRYSIIEGSGGSGNWSNLFGTDGGNNLDSDPLLAANLQLQNGSPAIDAGNTLSYTSSIPTDLAGENRIQNMIIDMGAFESGALTTAESIYLPSIMREENTSPTPAATPVPNSTETPTPVATQVSTATPSASSVLVPGTSQITIDQVIEGVNVARTVYIQAPQSLDSSKSYPIVFALHGAGGSGQGFTSNEHLNGLINGGNFVGIYPNGHSNVGGDGGYWNLGTEPTTADDVEFVNLIVQKLGAYG